MSGVGAKTQDLPPPGGYRPINYKRVPARQYFNGYVMMGGYLGMTAGAAYLYYLNRKSVYNRELELRSAEFAIKPLLLAERDRAFLKQLRRNRDEEAKLMANVEGWKVGTWYGEPIYKTKPKTEELFLPEFNEYYIHSPYKDYARRGFFSLGT